MIAANAALAMPYPGLRPFEAEDQPLFFGREAQVSAMLLQLEDHRFVAVVGSSGSGKSSLVRAGLLPAVREGFLFGTADWLTTIIKPGHQPYERLVRGLSRVACRAEGTQGIPAYDDPLTPDETAALTTLRRTDRGLLTILDQLAIPPERRVMVVVDQFEELFAFRRGGANRETVASRDDAAAFVGMLIRSTSEPTSRVWAVLTMRSDFIGDCEAFLGLPEQISHSQFLVPRLDRGQMEEAIVQPASVEEGTFKTFTFKEGLVNRIINDAGDRPDQLPLMQHALMRTWKRAVARTVANGPVTVMPEDYETAGGIEMALSLHADAAWDEIKDDPKKAHIARRLFLLLCDISPDGQITRRRPKVAEVKAVTGASVAEIEQVVRIFQQDDRNFLLPPPPLTAESYLDISHEALLRQWRLFAGEWQEQERRDASELRRLAELASLCKQGQGGRLPAQDLERIDRWKQRVSAEWARRYVTKETWGEAISFVEESRAEVIREEQQRQKQSRQKRALVQLVAIILGAATIFSWVFAVSSNRAKVAAQEALTRSFVRTIGVSDEDEELSPDERAALWELAELGPANVSVRKAVIDHWFGSEEYLRRALKRHVQGLRAAVGLNFALRDYSASKATDMADRLAKRLENPQEASARRLQNLVNALAGLAARMEPKDVASVADVLAKAMEDPKTEASQLSNLGNTLAALAARMDPKDAASVSSRGAQVLAKAMEDPKTGASQLSDFGNTLAALAARMDPKDAASVSSRGAQVLAKAMEDPKTGTYQLSDLGNTLAALAARMDPKDVASVADVLANAMEDPKTGASQLLRFGETLAALAARMEPKDVAGVADVLAKAMEDPKTEAYQLSDFGNTLAALAARMDPKDAASVSSRGAQVLAKAVEDPKTEASQLSDFGNTLAALAARMDPKDAASVSSRGVQVLAKAMEDPKTGASQLSNFGNTLAALAARMDPKDAASVSSRAAQVLAKAMEDPKTEAYQLSNFSYALAALAARMEPRDAASVADVLAKAMEDPKTGASQLLRFGETLAAFAARMEPKDVASLADVLAKAMEDPKTEAYQLSDFGNTLAALAARTEPKDAASVSSRGAQVLAKAMEDPKTEASGLSNFGNTLAALAARMEPKDAASVSSRGAQVLAKAMEDPKTGASQLLRFGETLAALAARMEPKDAASVSSRGAQVLAKAMEDPKTGASQLLDLGNTLAALAARMEPKGIAGIAGGLAKAVDNPQETDARRLSSLGWTLGQLSSRIPSARQTRSVALSILMNEVLATPKVGKVEPERKQLTDLYALLKAQDLAEVLKWPFCVGETEKIALAELETKTGRKFGDDIWKFVEQAPSLGIKDLNAPAKRPKVKDALTELKSIATGNEVPRSSVME